jgi:hypothetical protein
LPAAADTWRKTSQAVSPAVPPLKTVVTMSGLPSPFRSPAASACEWLSKLPTR